MGMGKHSMTHEYVLGRRPAIHYTSHEKNNSFILAQILNDTLRPPHLLVIYKVHSLVIHITSSKLTEIFQGQRVYYARYSLPSISSLDYNCA